MKISFQSFLRGLVFGAFLISASGCAAVIVGSAVGAGVAYIKGTLEANFDRPVKQMHKSSLAALHDLKLNIKEEELTPHSSHVVAAYEDGTKVHVSIDALTEKASRVKIRIGIFGDQQKSEIIMDAIKKKA